MTGLHTKILIAICLFPLSGGISGAASPDEVNQVTILYTNDEHGWMQGMQAGQGAANLYALWQEQENYHSDGPFLVLSGGDNWTGPAISTWTQGESMVEVMNAMNYDATAVGNHEFDFGLDALRQRTRQARYPHLSANTRWRDSGETPKEIGILPFTIKTVSGIRFGIIGLTTTSTRVATNPAHIADLAFLDYEPALRETFPHVQAHDPDIIIVIAHVCVNELKPLISSTQDLGIAMMGAGHCNELIAERIGNTVLLGGGYHFASYAAVTFDFDPATKAVLHTAFRTREYIHENQDAEVAAIIDSWADEMDDILSEEVAYIEAPLRRDDETLGQLIVNSWLEFDPSADVAISNAGGIRIDLPAGKIDMNTMVSLMPFDNTIIAAQISGTTLRQALTGGGRPIVGGLQRNNDQWIVSKTGQALQPDQTYRVLLNSFMYAGGDGFGIIKDADPDAFDTGVNYRQPFIDWLQAQDSSASNPLRF